MTLSQAKCTPSSHGSRSPHPSPEANSEAELYVPDFTQFPAAFPPPDRHRVRRITLAVLLTLGVLMFLTAIIIHSTLVTQADVAQQKRADQQEMLSRINSLEKAGGEENYRDCITHAKTLLLTANLSSLVHMQTEAVLKKCQTQIKAQIEIKDTELLERANQAAAKDQLKNAIALASQVEGKHRLAAQELISQWSGQILTLAEDAYEGGNLDNAVKMARAIAPDNLLYETSQTKIKLWNQDWAMDAAKWKMADTAMKNNQIETARSHIKHLMASHNPYWQRVAYQLQANVDQLQIHRESSLRTSVLTWMIIIIGGWGWLSCFRGHRA
ncbi:MAG: hypothetical protein KME15_06535 [Drouetiella hepatica Uher 2000/2452]|jgi:hypothetical protein|uniref:Uncharacterized protein n=1 Tax=Drouetiella hepatica Uher 2000/2452 TaxID=904376 RepID=A0A951ULN9_9CYAN|nr:hypothetical protein [Drouetiella hepatica Uher 2000/2452]